MMTSKLMQKVMQAPLQATLHCTMLHQKDIHQLWLFFFRVEPTSMLKMMTFGHHSMWLPTMATRQSSKSWSNMTTSELMHKPIETTLHCTMLQGKDIHQLWLFCSRGEPTSMLKMMTSGHHSKWLPLMATMQSFKSSEYQNHTEIVQLLKERGCTE